MFALQLNPIHPIDPGLRSRHFRIIRGMEAFQAINVGAARVTFGQGCWIGMNALIFKGVTVGDETVVAGGSVVVDDLPPRVIAAGNPARPIKGLTH